MEIGEESRDVGGIDLDARKLALQIRRGSKSVSFSADQQDLSQINIQGFMPIIYRIEPVDIQRFLD